MLFTRENGAPESCLCIDLPIVGSKFKGPALFIDTPNQEYWEVMPKFSADEERLQRALLLNKITGSQHSVLDLTFQRKVNHEPVEQPKAIESASTWRQAGFGFGTVAATASSD